ASRRPTCRNPQGKRLSDRAPHYRQIPRANGYSGGTPAEKNIRFEKDSTGFLLRLSSGIYPASGAALLFHDGKQHALRIYQMVAHASGHHHDHPYSDHDVFSVESLRSRRFHHAERHRATPTPARHSSHSFFYVDTQYS